MTDHENRKHANVPTGYIASYGQNGITYKRNTQPTRSQAFPWAVVLVGVLIVAAVTIAANVTLFEDGSFILGPLSGCLPSWTGAICN